MSVDVEKPKRRRASGDGVHEHGGDAAAMRPPETETAAFRPLITKINAIAKRTIRTGQYENFEISTMVEAERDPNFSVQHNISMINRLVTQEVNELAEEIRKQVEVTS